MANLQPGCLLRALENPRHCARIYEQETLNDIDIPPGTIVMFLHYDESDEGWEYGELAMVLFGDVRCSIVLYDFERVKSK